jgi:hypothetical protein
MIAGFQESETSATIIASGRLSPFVPTNSLGGNGTTMWGWIDERILPWIYSYGHDVWIYVYGRRHGGHEQRLLGMLTY